MAAAETARLIASLELQDKNFTRGIKRVESGVGRVDKKLGAFSGFLNRNLARGIDRAAASLVDGVFAGVDSLVELEQQQAQTNAVLKSTGMIAGVTADQVTNLAEKYEGINALMGDEVIRSGENLLLTFTNINKKAFEPTLEAALNMNTALGKGPEGLTSTVIQVGKAMQDPVKGITALRKAGVNFTKDQQKKIKSLVKEGKLYEAQQIILKELNTEFGGSFANQGDTTAGKVAKFHDAVEDLQRTFAKALLPIIVKVADKLGTFLGDPAVVAGIERAGETLGEIFDQMLVTAERIPWTTIGKGLQMAAGFAGEMVTWFQKMPDWAQAFLIGGFVATKLPVIGGLVSELGKGLIKGVLGMTAGVVHLKAATVVGGGPSGIPGAPVPGGKGGGLLGLGLKGPGGLLLGLTGVGLAAMLAEEFHDEISGLGSDIGQGIRDWLKSQTGIELPKIRIDQLEWPFGPKNTPTILPEIFGGNGLLGGTGAPLPSNRGGGDRPSPGNPGALRRDIDKIGFEKWITEAQNIKAAIKVSGSEQKAELANIKNASATLNTTTSTGLTTVGTGITTAAAAAGTAAAGITNTARMGLSNTAVAARNAGVTTANAMTNAANRIVTAVNGLDLSVNVTTVNRTSTVNNRYGPSGGSSTTQRAYGPTG